MKLDIKKPPSASSLRMKAARMIAGQDFERSYARTVVEAAKEVVLNQAYEATNDMLRHGLDEQRSIGGPSIYGGDIVTEQERAYSLLDTDGVASNIVHTWAALTIGNGVFVEIEEGQRMADGRDPITVWEEFDRRVGYTRKGGIVFQSVLDHYAIGEVFNWFLAPEEQADDPDAVPVDMRTLLGIGGQGSIKKIKTAKGDIKKVLAYERKGQFRDIPPEQITHWRLNDKADVARSRSILAPVLVDILRLRTTATTIWLTQEFLMRMLSVVAERTDEDAPQLDQLVLPKPLTVTETPKGYTFREPDLSKLSMGGRAEDTPERVLLGRVARGVHLPYHLVAQEFREANLASLVAAEGPTAKLAEMRQARIEHHVDADVRKVVGEDIELTVNVPPVIISDPAEERKSWLDVWVEGGISWRTFAEKVGIDPDDEEARIDLERTKAAELIEATNDNSKLIEEPASSDDDDEEDEGELGA